MPLYAYECVACEFIFEKMAAMKDAPHPQPCPDCGVMCQRRFLPPACHSDCTRYRGDNTGGNQFDHPAHRALYMDKARAAGVTTEGKCYYPELARFQGDPEAWCGSNDEIRRVAEDRGYDVDGDVKVRARSRKLGPAEPGGLSERIVNMRVAELLREKPSMSRQKAIEDVVNKHAPPGKKRIVKSKPKVRR